MGLEGWGGGVGGTQSGERRIERVREREWRADRAAAGNQKK